jgi:hypothetical protein
MRIKILVISIAVVLTAASLVPGQKRAAQKAVFAGGKHSVTIPLDIDNNIIRMKMRVNGSRELTMIFDTGAGMTAIDEHFVKELGLKTTGDTLDGKGTGGTFTGSYVKSSTLSVDGAQVPNQPVAAFKIPVPPGFEFDGIIGYDFIAPFVVEIDYQKKTMVLSDPSTYVYRGKGAIIPLDLRGRDTPLVRASMKINGRATFPVNLELDTGADGAFKLNRPASEKWRVQSAFKEVTESHGRGAGGEESRVMVRFASVRFGPFTIKNPPVVLSLDTKGAGAATDNDGIIGGEILRRFKVIIDYSRKRMILEKNNAFNEPYDVEDGE